MTDFLEQAKHNENFLAVIENHVPDSYFDWKITIIFYTALHYIKHLSQADKKNKKRIGDSHVDIKKNINPNEPSAKMPVDIKVYQSYLDLFNSAHTSRYNGFKDKKMFNSLMKWNYNNSKEHLSVVKNYCKKQGLKI